MPTALFYTPALLNYDFGPGHAFRGDRFTSFLHHFHKILGDHPDFQLITHDCGYFGYGGDGLQYGDGGCDLC